MQNDDLLEPVKAYESKYRDLHKKNTEDYFDDLAKKAKVNIAENRDTVKKYKKKLIEIDKIEKKLSGKKVLRMVIIVMMFVITIALGYMSYLSLGKKGLPTYVGILGIVGIVLVLITGILIIVKKINKQIQKLADILSKLQKEAQELLNMAWDQMSVLNSLYDWGIPGSIITKTTPIIQMDKIFDPKKFEYLNAKYGLEENLDVTDSTCFVQSGSILGNPFLISKNFIQEWYQKLYTGSITIHWTTVERTKDGSRTVHHSQVLTASISKPAPKYRHVTKLIYGNDAAPNLSFTREPSNASNLDEDDLEKKIKKGSKKLEKKARKAIMNNTNYTKLGNDEFEVLFGANDRDNEMEFRLLYTVLAQRNIVKLLKNPVPYGDDFFQQKKKCLNYIWSRHSQSFNYYAKPTMFVNYDFDAARKFFIDYNVEYFRSFFYDMAPLLSIPLYQQHKPKEYIYKNNYPSNVTAYEHEAMANSFDINLLKSRLASTPSILKTSFVEKNGIADKVKITAHAFNAQKRVTYIQKFGGDGRYHSVPVYWVEYVPVSQDSYMAIEPKESSRFEFNSLKKNETFNNMMNKIARPNGFVFERGLFATLLLSNAILEDFEAVNSVYVGNVIKPTEDVLHMVAKLAMDVLEEVNKNEELEKAFDNDDSEGVLSDESLEAVEVEASEEDKKQDE